MNAYFFCLQVMLWERKLQLEKEMQDAIDPEAGNDVVEAMKKEVHRMRVRYNELIKLQEKLITELERSVAKRDIIGTKGRSMQTREKSRGGDATEAGHVKQARSLLFIGLRSVLLYFSSPVLHSLAQREKQRSFLLSVLFFYSTATCQPSS